MVVGTSNSSTSNSSDSTNAAAKADYAFEDHQVVDLALGKDGDSLRLACAACRLGGDTWASELRIFDLSPATAGLTTLLALKKNATCVEWLADGVLATGDDFGVDVSLVQGDGDSYDLRRVLRLHHEDVVLDVQMMDSKNELVSCSRDYTAKTWDVETGTMVFDFESPLRRSEVCKVAYVDEHNKCYIAGGRVFLRDDRDGVVKPIALLKDSYATCVLGVGQAQVLVGTEEGDLIESSRDVVSILATSRSKDPVRGLARSRGSEVCVAYESGAITTTATSPLALTNPSKVVCRPAVDCGETFVIGGTDGVVRTFRF